MANFIETKKLKIYKLDMKKQIPTLLCYLRIALIVPFVGLFYIHQDWAVWAMLVVYIVAAFTDWLDGFLARRWQVQTVYGAMIDQISDKMFVAAVILVLMAMGNLAGYLVPAAIVILIREIFVSGLREYLGQNNTALPVSKLGKWKTASQMVALAFLIIYPIFNPAALIYKAGASLLWLAAILSVFSAWQYLNFSYVFMTRK